MKQYVNYQKAFKVGTAKYAQEKVKPHETAEKLLVYAVSGQIKEMYDGVTILPCTLHDQVSNSNIGVSPSKRGCPDKMPLIIFKFLCTAIELYMQEGNIWRGNSKSAWNILKKKDVRLGSHCWREF